MIICFQLNVYQPWPLARYYTRSTSDCDRRGRKRRGPDRAVCLSVY